jgi:hypothetical protein
MKEKMVKALKRVLVNEILIDFKACVYFFCVVLFYSVAQLCRKSTSVEILTLLEIILTNYVICYVQTYIFKDFDEAERLGTNEAAGILMCTFLYTLASLLFGWFGGSSLVTGLFAMYIAFTYVCVILCYIVRRKLDTRQLNRLLDQYKQNEGRDSHEC